MTAEVIKIGDFRAKRDAQQIAAGIGAAPCDSEASPIKQVHRASARRQLEERLALVEEQLTLLEKNGVSVEEFRKSLAAEQPLIDQFNRLIPPTSRPYSPRMSDSMAMLSEDEYVDATRPMDNLKALAELLMNGVRHAEQITQIRRSLNTIRHQAKARNLRMRDWDDPDLGLCEVIDYAVNAPERVVQCDRMLDDAQLALAEQRWSDLYRLIEEASKVPAYLHVAENALQGGALEEIPASDSHGSADERIPI
ncbi:MAG TPA: hypothetical protein V6D22_18405 [Candidatus Obscuribacterales bacterium]